MTGAVEPGSRWQSGWTILAALIVYAVVVGGSWPGVYAVPLRALSLFVVAVVLVAWAVLARRRPEWRPRTAIWPAVAAPLAAFAVSTTTSSFPRLGLDYLALAVLLAALYLLLVRALARPTMRAWIGGLAAAMGLAVGVIYIATVTGLWIEWWALVGRIETPPLRPLFSGLTWGNPSAVLSVTVLLLLVAAAGLGAATRARVGLVAAQALVTLVVIVLTGSRAGWLALVLAVIVVGLPWLVLAAPRDRLRATIGGGVSRAVMAVAALVVGAAALLLAPGILARIEEGGDGGRPTYFATALRMFVEDPLLGTGPGTWAARRIVHTRGGEIDYYIPHAHDVYLQTVAELGIVGAAAGLVMVGSAAWLAWRAVRDGAPERRRWAWTALFAGAYMAFHSLFDSYANMPAVLLLLVIPVAWLDGASERRLGLPAALAPWGRALALAATLGLAAACVASVVFLARTEAIAFAHEGAVDRVDRADWRTALERASGTVRDDPDIPAYRFTQGLAAAGAGEWALAAEAFAAAAAIDDLPQSWLGLALAQIEMRAPVPEVSRTLRRAYRLGVQQPAVVFAIGRLYERLGLTAEADRAYVAAIGQLPSLAGDPLWRTEAALVGRFDGVVERAIRSYPSNAWEVALMAGDPTRARELVAGSPDPELSLLVIAAWSGDDRAAAAVLAEADRDPLDARALQWAARVSDLAGERGLADRYRRITEIGLPDSEVGYEVRVGERVTPRDAEVGSRAANYGRYMYRRPTPLDPLVPGIPGLVRADGPAGTGPRASDR